MRKTYWEIRGFSGLRKIFEKHAPAGCFSERQIQDLLKALAAREGLTLDEIVGAYAKRKTKLANSLLSVHKAGPYPNYSCGSDPHFIARIVDQDLNPVTRRIADSPA
jgi:hypothetical protein